jgi:hypothetical protein
MIDNRVETIFQDAECLCHEAIEDLGRGKMRDAAEKAWGGNAESNKCLDIS